MTAKSDKEKIKYIDMNKKDKLSLYLINDYMHDNYQFNNFTKRIFADILLLPLIQKMQEAEDNNKISAYVSNLSENIKNIKLNDVYFSEDIPSIINDVYLYNLSLNNIEISKNNDFAPVEVYEALLKRLCNNAIPEIQSNNNICVLLNGIKTNYKIFDVFKIDEVNSSQTLNKFIFKFSKEFANILKVIYLNMEEIDYDLISSILFGVDYISDLEKAKLKDKELFNEEINNSLNNEANKEKDSSINYFDQSNDMIIERIELTKKLFIENFNKHVKNGILREMFSIILNSSLNANNITALKEQKGIVLDGRDIFELIKEKDNNDNILPDDYIKDSFNELLKVIPSVNSILLLNVNDAGISRLFNIISDFRVDTVKMKVLIQFNPDITNLHL